MRRKVLVRSLTVFVFMALGAGCESRDPFVPAPGIDAAALPTSCQADYNCPSTHRCAGEMCIPRCSSPPVGSLVRNPDFDRDIWMGADKDRGYGPRPPRWDSLDSTGCATSGSLVVNDRTAFSPPMQIGPTGSKYYWGFRAKLTRGTQGPYCEIHFCTDVSCEYFLMRDSMQPSPSTLEWQQLASVGVEVPVPNPPAPIPFAQIACFGYGEMNGPDVHYDRFYFSTDPVPF
jgi:hypothetical protein